MKHIIFTIFAIYFSVCVMAQSAENIIIGEKKSIYSKVLNEERKLWIYTPAHTSLYTNPDAKYPVLYVLDGEAHFLSTVGIVQQLSQANGNGVLPEMIIVGIGNTNRLRDLSPAVLPAADMDKANPFLKFLSSELIPFIDNNYKTSPYKLLVGHSLGGLTVIDIMTNFPQMFNSYIAIDPSMWYNNEGSLNQTIARLPGQNLKGTRLFIGTANTFPKGFNLSKLKKDKSTETQHIRSILKLDEFLRKSNTGLKYAQKFYEKERHNTVPLISEFDGLRFIFDYYFFDASEKDFTDPTPQIAARLKSHYSTISKEFGYKVAAPETFINYLAYDALAKKQTAKAKALFELNVDSYPGSSNVYDSYADYFLSEKDTLNAVKNLENALKIKPDDKIKLKLNSLTKKDSHGNANVDLQKYAGTYILETYNIPIVLEVRDAVLWAKVPGQKDDELQVISENVFTVKGKQGYTITFEMNGDKPVSFTSVQPNGTFKGVFKN